MFNIFVQACFRNTHLHSPLGAVWIAKEQSFFVRTTTTDQIAQMYLSLGWAHMSEGTFFSNCAQA